MSKHTSSSPIFEPKRAGVEPSGFDRIQEQIDTLHEAIHNLCQMNSNLMRQNFGNVNDKLDQILASSAENWLLMSRIQHDNHQHLHYCHYHFDQLIEGASVPPTNQEMHNHAEADSTRPATLQLPSDLSDVSSTPRSPRDLPIYTLVTPITMVRVRTGDIPFIIPLWHKPKPRAEVLAVVPVVGEQETIDLTEEQDNNDLEVQVITGRISACSLI